MVVVEEVEVVMVVVEEVEVVEVVAGGHALAHLGKMIT